ncbi:MAG: ABC transporter substrate-binding protein [Proteobacteria bacterium]|nr:ABC transporter substrate-binding protein [Pseudomonadota bacterium]
MQKIFISLFIVCSFWVPVKADGADDARVFVTDVVTKALNIINHDSMKDVDKRKALSESITDSFDLNRIAGAVFTTAKYKYKHLDSEDQKLVQRYLKQYLLDFYASEGKLNAMVNARLDNVTKVEAKDKDFAVTTKFIKDGKSTEIVWITDGKSIFYVIIAGVNQVITLKSEMAAAIGDEPLVEYARAKLVK